MAIESDCPECGRKVSAPDELAGKKARCPFCQAVMTVPEAPVYEAEAVPPPRAREPEPPPRRHEEPPFRPRLPPELERITGRRPAADHSEESGGRRPCPMCGELIVAGALKCRYCGEVFDSDLRRRESYGRRGGRGYSDEINGHPLASRGARLGAALIDGFLSVVLLLPGLFFLLSTIDQRRPDPTTIYVAIFLLGAGALIIMLIQIILLSTQGQTVGKKAVGVRIVVHEDGSNPGFVGAFLMRSFVPGLIGAIPYLGGIFSLVDVLCIFRDDRRCLHDQMAGTSVVEI